MLTDDLLDLQRLDTTADQLAHRRAHLAERTDATDTAADLAALRARRAELDRRVTELDAAIAGLEQDGEQLTAQRDRLQRQLRTVVAPREAEALMHELDALAVRRDGMDDTELGHLEEQAELDAERVTLAEREPVLADAARRAADALAHAEAAVDSELADIRAAREVLVGRLDGGVVERYARLRTRMGGVAVAHLEGSRCSGCHLDLSRAELEEVRATEPGSFADCPQCGRMLVP